jgi:putative transposase
MKWLYEGTNRYFVPILNFTVTSNHIHLLVLAPDDMEAIPRLMQLVAGRVGQVYNKSRNRKGAFWEKRYTATAVQTDEHLARCFLYIDLNMVRAKVVKHPRKWEHGGYHEIVKTKQRYRTINRKEVTRLLDVKEKELGSLYQSWIKEALKQGNLRRNAVWSSELAVGDDGFVEMIKKNIGRWVSKISVQEDLDTYGQIADMTQNVLDWEIFADNNL